MYKDMHVRRASAGDVGLFEDLLKAHAEECGELDRYDALHARRHMAHLLSHDLSFVALRDGLPIGCIMCEPIDLGFRLLSDFQTAHVFVVKAHRDLTVVTALFDSMEELADSRGARLVLTQLDYLAAVNGLESNGKRYEKLLRRRGYRGPINQCFARQPYVHVGIAYLYDGKSVHAGDPIQLPEVRLIPSALAVEAGDVRQSPQSGTDDLVRQPQSAG